MINRTRRKICIHIKYTRMCHVIKITLSIQTSFNSARDNCCTIWVWKTIPAIIEYVSIRIMKIYIKTSTCTHTEKVPYLPYWFLQWSFSRWSIQIQHPLQSSWNRSKLRYKHHFVCSVVSSTSKLSALPPSHIIYTKWPLALIFSLPGFDTRTFYKPTMEIPNHFSPCDVELCL